MQRLRDVGEVGLLNHGRAPDGNSGWRTLCVFPKPSRMSLAFAYQDEHADAKFVASTLRRELRWPDMALSSAFQITVPSSVAQGGNSDSLPRKRSDDPFA